MLSRYRAERMPPLRILPLAALLALAARVDAARSISGFMADAGILLLLVAQFRLWDDIADQPLDRIAHPDRVLVRAQSDTPFKLACAVLAIVNLAVVALVYRSPAALASLAALDLGMAFWYVGRRTRTAFGDHMLLLKYPLVVVVVACGRGVERPWLVSCSAAAVYLAACLYEAAHDPAAPARRNRALVACEACLLVVSFAILAVTSTGALP